MSITGEPVPRANLQMWCFYCFHCLCCGAVWVHCEAAEKPWSGGCVHPLDIWGQNFSLPCSARRRAREGTRSSTCSQWNFPLLPPKCQQGREGGGHGSFPDRECPPTPPVRAVTGGSRRGKQIWEVTIGTEQLRVLGFAFRSTPYLHVFVHDCYEIHKPCRRRLSCQPKATRYRLYFTAVCREVKNCITTDYHFQKKLYSAELRTLCSAFRIVLFLSCVCRQQRSLHG